MQYDVAVVGSGPAGAEVASLVSKAGMKTVLVTATPPGGRATVGSLLPSKVWLHAGHRRDSRELLPPEEAQRIAETVRGAISARSSDVGKLLVESGVTVIQGSGKIKDPHTVVIDSREPIAARHIVLAGGSEPIFAEQVRPTGKRIIAPRHTKLLEEIPKTLVMVGGGVTGVEYASAFARLGSRVTILPRRDLLPSWDREYVGKLKAYLGDLGVEIHATATVTEVVEGLDSVTATTADGRRFSGDYAFIATGRAADLESIAETPGALEALGLRTENGFLVVDGAGRTSVSGVFACGDITGPPLVANKAILEARRVAYALTDGKIGLQEGPEPVIQAVFTEPQLAEIGPVSHAQDNPELHLERRSYGRLMLAHIHREVPAGEVKVWLTAEKRVVAAAAIGENAADVLAPVQLALNHGITWSELTAVPFAYPTLTEVLTT